VRRRSSASALLPQEQEGALRKLLVLQARQARRVPVPVLFAATVIAAVAYGHAPLFLILAWMGLVIVLQAVRWHGMTWLALRRHWSIQQRTRLAVALSALTGWVHGLSAAFFPDLGELERAVLTMVLIGLSAGAVATTVGSWRSLLAYVTPALGPLAVMWAVWPSNDYARWVTVVVAVLIVMFAAVVMLMGRDVHWMFLESYRIRLDQRRLNRDLRRALDQAEAANRAKTRFLASASHDLRQPMHTLSLFGAALSMRPLDERSRTLVGQLNASMQALSGLLNELLDVSKLDAGVVRAQPGSFNLSRLLAKLAGEYGSHARAKGLTLTVQCPDNACCLADALLLERLLRNLVDNAVKYTDRGTVHMAVHEEPGAWRIEVIDTGSGIPLAEQERVFEEFYQLGNPERDRARGLGLGLSIVRRIADLLGLQLQLHSIPGEGTSVALSVPATPTAEMAAAQVEDVPHRRLDGLRVLVVDDEEAVRQGMQALLEAHGCEVLLAGGTHEALALAHRVRPHLLLADFRLRGGDDGLQTVRAVRAVWPGLPAALISGDSAPARLRDAHEAGVRLLHKPVPASLLRQILEEARPSAGQEAPTDDAAHLPRA
jgi:signal transduction histidine kinase/CheY-like chemotaxis protein